MEDEEPTCVMTQSLPVLTTSQLQKQRGFEQHEQKDKPITILSNLPESDDEDMQDEPIDITDNDDLSDLAFSVSDVSEDCVEVDMPLSREGQLLLIHERAEFDSLNRECAKLKKEAQQTREEIKKNMGRIEELSNERNTVYEGILNAEETSNTASLYRLRSHHDRICQEIEGEEDILDDLRVKLLQKEYEMNKGEVRRATFTHNHQDSNQREVIFAKQKQIAADERIAKEEKQALLLMKSMDNAEIEYSNALNQKQRAIRRVIEEANKSRVRVQKFINMNLTKIKHQNETESKAFNERLHKRMDMLLKLKADIASNRENIRALAARDNALRQKASDSHDKTKHLIEKKGLNADHIMVHHQRVGESQHIRQKFETDQKVKHTEIMTKILKEEDDERKKKKMYPSLFATRKTEAEKEIQESPFKIPRTFDLIEKTEEPAKPLTYRTIIEGEEEEDLQVQQSISIGTWDTVGSTIMDNGESLDRPQFEGLWHQHKPYKVVSGKGETTSATGNSKMDKEIFEKRMTKHREGIVVKQVVAGREFKGQAFYSKPDVIHFKDFDVGKSYKKKVVLTNVSYSVNYCTYVEITEHLKDFIHIHFEPPGSMSAGMTCEMSVTFKPMINEDLKGEVFFLAQTGPFSIPLVCTTKKCDLSLDMDKVDFGVSVIGETLKRSLTLTNKGAQGTSFDFCKINNMKWRSMTTPETSLGRMTTLESVKEGSGGAEVVKDKSARKSNEGTTSAMEAVELKEGTEEIIEGEREECVNTALVSPDKPQTPDAEEDDIHSVEEYEAEEIDGMTPGDVTCGYISPFSSVRLDIVWRPTIPGDVNTEFIVSFDDLDSNDLTVYIAAKAIHVPVWVERDTIDLKMCMFDRLYQDTLIINNRATTALKLKFEVPKELKNHLEVLPKTGKHLGSDASLFFDNATGVLEVPLVIRVAHQTRPVPFTVMAVITNSDLHFSVKDLNFGFATIYESAKITVQLTNRSILPQEFGFIGLPDYMDVQPNDGFGTLLPLETIDLDVIFSPKKAGNYAFSLTCKSLINRDFTITCEGTGVHPLLELSHQVVHLPATAVYDVSTTSIHVCNSHTSTNEFTHPVPRIGKGEIAPVGPTTFEFVLPDDCPLTISPRVSTVLPGHECLVEICFKPELIVDDIKEEAMRIALKQQKAQAERVQLKQQESEREQDELSESIIDVKPSKSDRSKTKKKAAPKTKKPSGSVINTLTIGTSIDVPIPTLESITNDSPAYWTAMSSLLRHFTNQFATYTIPCYVASGKCGDPALLKYSIHNTLYLQVHCPVVKPSLLVISNNGNTITNFKDICIGQAVTKAITVQNITNKPLQLMSSILHSSGPFVMLNALRLIPPDGSHTILISFTPTAGEIFHEVLKIHTGISSLHLTLLGHGVEPNIKLNVDNVLDMGAVLVGEYLERLVTLQNISSLSVNFAINLDSQSPFCHLKSQETPTFLHLNDKPKFLVGTQNYNGQNVFDCVPCQGTIIPGATAEITVTFAPDHTSQNFSDFARIQLFGQEETYSFQLCGTAKPSIMYISGVDTRTPDMEILALSNVDGDKTEEVDLKPEAEPLLFTLYSKMLAEGYEAATRQLFVGCVRTMAVSQKKSGEFTFENNPQLTLKGFNIEPLKGLVEAGSQKPVTITWLPTADHNPNEPVETSIVVSLRGDTTEQFRLMIRALVIS